MNLTLAPALIARFSFPARRDQRRASRNLRRVWRAQTSPPVAAIGARTLTSVDEAGEDREGHSQLSSCAAHHQDSQAERAVQAERQYSSAARTPSH